ncbi:MAG TPA: TetR/AcrR family transcriptional regulator [Spirochaetota bacterium]|nr:TetR/AcrR family transcriptional regulator [Spirochaetota bacterium]
MPPKGEKRKQQIIDTAKEMFLTKGFQSTHIGQISDHLDIARGTVYQYFSNKKEILYAILENVCDDIEEVLDPDDLKDFLDKKADSNKIIDFVDNRIAACLSILSNEPIVIKLIYRDISGIDDEVSDKVSVFIARVIEIISKEIETLKKFGVYKRDIEPSVAASMLVGAIMMIMYQFIKKNQTSLDKTITKAIAITYLHGVYE